jgi:hypothetical protein
MHFQIFNVVLNNVHVVLPDLDIFREAGYATAHDEYVAFKVTNKGKTLVVDGESSDIQNGKVQLKFVKVELHY